MPQAYVKKLARKHGTSTRRAEGKWAKAKASAAESGHADNYAYVTRIFKNMMHETPYIPTLKDLTNGMTFKYFLVAEADEEVTQKREQSPEYRHLAKFPQFNELPFKARRELEKEVRADGLISDYETLEPEEKESVDDALQDLVIDKMQATFGTGVNVGDWAATDKSQEDDDLESAMDKWEDTTGMDAETGADLPVQQPRKRRERAPSHIAAMRGPHEMEPAGAAEPEAGGPLVGIPVGTRKSYYKPWSALSDEQRQGRAKLAQKHGKLYRIKQSKWYRLLDPEKQQHVVDAVKAGQPVPKF